jgi:prepilin-type N-terminal cleavage/methylation domain-containing protein
MRNLVKHNKISGFSLIETLVTLAIFGILMAMLSQVLILNLQVSRKISARTTIREELTQVVGLIQRDMRNADAILIEKCGNNVELSNSVNNHEDRGCELIQTDHVSWVLSNDDPGFGCENNIYNTNIDVKALCKLNLSPNPQDPTVMYKTSPLISIKNLSIEIESLMDENDETGKPSKGLLIITIEAEASNPKWDVNNQIRQIIVTTRNF